MVAVTLMWIAESESQIQRKLFMEEALRSTWSPVSSAKLVMWRLFHFSIVGWSILSGTPQFVCLKSSVKFEKRTRVDESLFTMTMRALTYRFKPAPFWPAKMSNWWVIRRTTLTWHPMTPFYSRTSRKNAWPPIFLDRRCYRSVQKPCFGGVSIEVEKVLSQVVWAHANMYKSCWRILWKTIKPFLMINIRIFIIRKEIYRVWPYRLVHEVSLVSVVRIAVRNIFHQ